MIFALLLNTAMAASTDNCLSLYQNAIQSKSIEPVEREHCDESVQSQKDALSAKLTEVDPFFERKRSSLVDSYSHQGSKGQPSWVTSIPSEKGILFGTGSAYSKQQALDEASGMISKQLRSSVKSSFEKRTDFRSKNDRSSTDVRMKSSNRTSSNTKIENLMVIDVFQSEKGQYHALAAIDFEARKRALKKKIDYGNALLLGVYKTLAHYMVSDKPKELSDAMNDYSQFSKFAFKDKDVEAYFDTRNTDLNNHINTALSCVDVKTTVVRDDIAFELTCNGGPIVNALYTVSLNPGFLTKKRVSTNQSGVFRLASLDMVGPQHSNLVLVPKRSDFYSPKKTQISTKITIANPFHYSSIDVDTDTDLNTKDLKLTLKSKLSACYKAKMKGSLKDNRVEISLNEQRYSNPTMKKYRLKIRYLTPENVYDLHAKDIFIMESRNTGLKTPVDKEIKKLCN